MRIPNLNALRMFDAAARHLNFRLAAEELNLTQGAVAQQVRRLETDLGLTLFHRQARGLALTDTGRGYHKPIRRAFALIEQATSDLAPQVSRVTISVTPSFATKWLVPKLAGFETAFPDIDLQTLASESLTDFRRDRVNLAIRQGSPPFDDDCEAELLAPLNLCVVCSPDYAKTVGPINSPKDFIAYRLVQDGHHQWDNLLSDAGFEGSVRKVQFNQTALSMDAAINGQGLAIVPHLLADTDLQQGRLVELWRDNQPAQDGYYLITPRTSRRSEAVDKVHHWITGEVARQTGSAPTA